MLLTSTSDILKITTTTTADIHVQAGWADITTSAFTPGRTSTIITSATTTTVIAAPGASTQRQVKNLLIFNAHASTSNVISVIHYDGTSNTTQYSRTLLAGQSVSYDGITWTTYDNNGVIITSTMVSSTYGSTGQVLQSAGASTFPTWSTPTYPSTSGTARKILVSDGTNNVYSTETYAVPSTSGKVMQSDGTNWTSATPTGTGAPVLASNPALVQPTADNFIEGYISIATAAGTTTLTVASKNTQVFTGSTTQTVVLPVVSTLVLGTPYTIVNLSSGVVTVQSSGANSIQAMQANSTLVLRSNATTGTDATVWHIVQYTTAASGQTGSGSLVRATSPALVTPALGTVASGVISACTSTSMTMVTPILGVAAATSINFGQDALNYYDEGTWTPVLTFATAGDLSVVYSLQAGTYTRVGRLVTVTFNISTSTFTYTTASGGSRITGIPFTPNATYTEVGAITFTGITKALYTQFVCRVPAVNYIDLVAQGSGQTNALVVTTDMPSATQQLLRGSISYEI